MMKTENKIDGELLELAAQSIESNAQSYDQKIWTHACDDEFGNALVCDTPACIAGHIVHCARQQFLDGERSESVPRTLSKREFGDYAMNLAGLTPHQARRLFNWNPLKKWFGRDSDHADPILAARVVRRLAWTGRVEWKREHDRLQNGL